MSANYAEELMNNVAGDMSRFVNRTIAKTEVGDGAQNMVVTFTDGSKMGFAADMASGEPHIATTEMEPEPPMAPKYAFEDDGLSEYNDDTSILAKAEEYMRENYKATREAIAGWPGDPAGWNGPGPGIWFAQFATEFGERFKVKVWWWNVGHLVPGAGQTEAKGSAKREARIEVVKVVDRHVLMTQDPDSFA